MPESATAYKQSDNDGGSEGILSGRLARGMIVEHSMARPVCIEYSTPGFSYIYCTTHRHSVL